MSDASHTPIPSRPQPSPDTAPAPVPDPEDFGTAFGMEMSIDATDKGDTIDDEDPDDPLAWMRRWVARHKAR